MIVQEQLTIIARIMAGAASVVSIGLLVGSGRGWIKGDYGAVFLMSTAVVVCLALYLVARRDPWRWRFMLVALGIVILGLLFPAL